MKLLLISLLFFSLEAFGQDLPVMNVHNPNDTIKKSDFIIKKSNTIFLIKTVDQFTKKIYWDMKNPILRKEKSQIIFKMNVGIGNDSIVDIDANVLIKGFGCFIKPNKIDFLFTDNSRFEVWNYAADDCTGFALIYLTKYQDYQQQPFLEKLKTVNVKAVRFHGSFLQYQTDFSKIEAENLKSLVNESLSLITN